MPNDITRRVTLAKVGQWWDTATRRDFLRAAALGGTAVLLPSVLAACGSDSMSDPTAPPAASEGVTLDLSTDAGVLNYAYALEQLEAAYYTLVVQRFTGSGLSAAEQAVLADIRNHEVIHRDFLAGILGSAKIPTLAVDFGAVNFADRVSVLTSAKTFEDAGVAAYNGAGKLLKDAANLLVAGKIVSVEARHAAAVRDLLRSGTRDFAGDDVVDPTGLDQQTEPGFILGGAAAFITTPIRVTS